MRQIVASGGGGWADAGCLTVLEEQLLELAPPRPRILLLPTASGDQDALIVRFHEIFGGCGARTSHLALFRPHPRTERGALLEQDLIYVSGGSSSNLLALWRVHGLVPVLRDAYERGIVLAGFSAGALCWFETGVSNSLGPGFAPVQGLGFLPGGFCPHTPTDPKRRPALERLLHTGEITATWAVADGTALHFQDERLAGLHGAGQAELLSAEGELERGRSRRAACSSGRSRRRAAT